MSSTAALLALVTAVVAPTPPLPAQTEVGSEDAVAKPEVSPSAESPQEAPSEPRPPADPKAAPPEVQPTRAPQRQVSIEPKPALPPPPGRLTFDVDPLADGAIIAVSLSFGFVVDAIASTGELRPQQIAPDFRREQLLAIDRRALTLEQNDAAAARANLGLFLGVGFAVVDPILSGVREKSIQTGLADAFIYAESMSLTFALTDMVKVAVRRPRPLAYAEAEEHRGDPSYSNSDTDSSLSFFSLHSSMTASIGATATYLAFARSPRTARPWVTLALATALSTFVSVERVRAGKHFPTDVIAGSVAGAGVGIVVPHLHRTDDIKQRRVWVGFAPVNQYEGERGGTLRLTGTF